MIAAANAACIEPTSTERLPTAPVGLDLPRRTSGRAAARPVLVAANPVPSSAELRSHLLFEGLSAEQLAVLRAASRIDELKAGHVLYERGQRARHFYLVLEGQVNLALHSSNGEEKIVEIIRAGQVFAEAVMFLDESSYQLTAIAASPTRLARFSSATYLDLLRQNPVTCLHMLGHMSRRLHGRIRDIEHLSFASATDRLVRMLLARLPECEGPLDLRLDESRQELAAFLSMQPETLSRSLRALASTGAVQIEGRLLRVPSRARLAAQLQSAS